jgi:hypothetical protein
MMWQIIISRTMQPRKNDLNRKLMGDKEMQRKKE